MDQKSPGPMITSQKTNSKHREKTKQTDAKGATYHSDKPYKVAPIIVKGLSNTSRKTLDSILRLKLPNLRIDNIIYNQNAKLYTIQPTDVHSYQELLNNFPKDSFPKDQTPSIYVPAAIRQVLESESVCFMKNVDLEFEEDELRQALGKEGIQTKHLERMTRPGDTAATRKPTMTIKIICSDKKNRDTLLRAGLRISYCLFRCEPARPNDTPLQCRKCNGFGHIAKYCRAASETCARCGAQHRTTECQAPNPKCSNCGSNHAATSRQCPSFIEQQAKLRRTIEEYSAPIQSTQASATKADYLRLPTPTPKRCQCDHEQADTKMDAIVEQIKATNALVHDLTTAVTQLMKMQKAMLAAFA